jgi:four helix bundle protein
MTGKPQIKTFRDLDVWKLGMELVLETYAVAMKLPASEQYELSRQLRRAAVSIPSNIAEGHTRRGRAYRNHVRIALGSMAELETQVEAAIRLGFLTSSNVAGLLQTNARVGQMLFRLSASLTRAQWTVNSSLALLACAGCAALLGLLG